jgi:uncharacterized protein
MKISPLIPGSSSPPPLELRQDHDGVTFTVVVQPKARRNELIGILNQALKVKLTAPPVEGAANEALVKFLARFFRIRKSDITILRGETAHHKLIHCSNLTAEALRARLSANLR